MIALTREEALTLLHEVHNDRGWTRLSLDDVLGAAKLSDTDRDLIEYLREWNNDYRIEAEAEDRAAAWFEEASY